MATIKVIDVADEIWRELGEPDGFSIPAISFWLRTNIGKLNDYLYLDLTLTDAYEFIPEIDEGAKAIFKKMYEIYYYDRQIRELLTSGSIDSVVEVTSDGGTVRRISKNEYAKTFKQLRKDTVDELNLMAAKYTNGKSIPLQVAGDDTISYNLNPLERNRSYYSRY